jgi:basic membrane lipoprotein Med (substrate-binding protein (PBP1-ABC) superfamily)
MRILHLASLLLLALLLPFAAACGGTAEAPTTTETETEATPAEEATEAEPEAEPTPAEEATEAEDTADATPEDDVPADEEALEEAAPAEGAGDISVGLVTDIGQVNDGTFNEFAHEGATRAADEYGLEYSYIETQAPGEYEQNIDTMLNEEFDVIVTVGFLIADATYAAAEANPDTVFIGVDQDFSGDRTLPNLIGIQFREDQAGFLVGALAGMMTESDIVGFVGGVEIPPVQKFRNGYAHGIQYVNPDATLLDVYIPDFVAPAEGASAAQQQMGEGADVIFGAGGKTGSGAISEAAAQGVYVIGVDQDEYVTTFGNGESPGADYILTSAIKRVNVGVYEQISAVVDDSFEGNGNYILNASNDGVGYADFHDAADDIPEDVKNYLEEIRQMLAEGELTTGVNPVSGAVIEDEIPEPQPFEEQG